MRYEFRPDHKKIGRNQYVGKWEESPCNEIELPFTIESLRKVLSCGLDPDNAPYTHQEIAHWCDRMQMMFLDTDEEPEFDHAISIAADVDCQWDLYLANTYSLKELQGLNFAEVKLPVEMFSGWLKQLGSIEQHL